MTNIPFVKNVTTSVSGTGGVSVDFAGNADVDDLLIIAVATANQAVSTPSGWTLLNSAQGGTAGVAGGYRLTVFYKLSVGGETTVSLADPGDHILATGYIIRGNDVSTPINISSFNTVATSTTATFPAVTTTVNDCLILNIIASDTDSAAARLSAWANASLSNVTEISDIGTTSGSGSGLGAASGGLATAGSTGSTTATLTGTSPQARATIAIAPTADLKVVATSRAFNLTGISAGLRTEAFNLETLRFLKSKTLISGFETFLFTPDGTRLLTARAGVIDPVIREYTLSTAWDINTATSSGVSIDLTSITTSIAGLAWNSNGTELFFFDKGGSDNSIKSIALGTAYLISTATITTVQNFSSAVLSGGKHIEWSSDGTYFFVSVADALERFTTTTAWTLAGSTNSETNNTLTNSEYWAFTLGRGNTLVYGALTSPDFRQSDLNTFYSIASANVTNGVSSFDPTGTAGLIDAYHFQWSTDGRNLYATDSGNVLYQFTTLPEEALTADPASFSLTGIDNQFQRGYNVTADVASFILTGIDASPLKDTIILADQASFTLTGITADLSSEDILIADPASFNLSGQATTFERTYILDAVSTNFSLTNIAAGTLKEFTASADVSSFILIGQNNNFLRDYVLNATSGSFSTSGIPTGTAYIRLPSTNFTLDFKVPFYVGEQVVYKVFPPAGTYTTALPAPSIQTGVNVAVPVHNLIVTSGIDYYEIRLFVCTGQPAPLDHVEDSKKLQADAYVDLFQITLSDNSTNIYLKMNKDVTWQGNTYEGTGIKIEGVGTYADDEVARPKLTLFNPEGIFSYLVDQGLLENAKVSRYRVLKQHIDEDVPVFRRQQWFIKRVASLRRDFIGLELRDMIDGQYFLVPGRMFIPPEFPAVSLQ